MGCGYMDGEDCELEGNVRGICPEGWHLPSVDEWRDFINGVGGEFGASKMLRSTAGWNDNGNGVDAYSFSALPAGLRDDNGNFKYAGETAGFWTSTKSNKRKSYYSMTTTMLTHIMLIVQKRSCRYVVSKTKLVKG